MNLKPCPFCGRTQIVVLTAQEIEKSEDETDSSFAAICDFDNGGCGATGGYRETAVEAAAAWNARS